MNLTSLLELELAGPPAAVSVIETPALVFMLETKRGIPPPPHYVITHIHSIYLVCPTRKSLQYHNFVAPKYLLLYFCIVSSMFGVRLIKDIYSCDQIKNKIGDVR